MKKEYKVLPRIPLDKRLSPDRHTDTRFTIQSYASREAVDRRREELRFNLRMAAGLYPWPEKTPLNTKTELVGNYEGYCLYKIMFESRPGFWSTGNLYLPDPLPEKAPAILNVFGHWDPQRLTRRPDGAADYPQQLANFARMGFVCLATDMIGKVDSLQISHEYGRYEKELWASNGLGVQLWNNIRALDLLCELPYVDADHIGVTGASGGGSQSLFLGLLDERIRACAPINMISLHFQGGCQCENAAGLRRDTNNGEMCAMIAPRALFLAGSTGDWTSWQETEEVPAMLEAYRHYGAEDMVEHYYQVADHQYNAKTRRRIYSFFARHLMGKEILWDEQPIDVPDLQAHTWFAGKGHAPGYNNDAEFFEGFKAERSAAVAKLPDCEKKKMLTWVTGIRKVAYALADPNVEAWDGVAVEKSIVMASHGEQIPWMKLTPANWDGKSVCLALGGAGKECLDNPAVRAKLDDGVCVISGDLFMTGEYTVGPKKVAGPLNAYRYFTTFHYTADAYRAQDVSLLWTLARGAGEECTIWADGCAARSVACALPLLEGVAKAELEAEALAITGDDAYYRDCFIPGILTLGGVEGCLSMAGCEVVRF
ncbi:MAG: hypothetical protein E7463_10460 [Ruminococcaceae bacterium]|nr:hypothetical protein [Oscillospiraceae bacterium]